MDVWSLFNSPNLGTYNMKIQKHDLSANLGRGALVARPRCARRSPQMRLSLVPDALKAIGFKSATAVPPLIRKRRLETDIRFLGFPINSWLIFLEVTANIVYLCRNKKACDYENRR